MEIPTLLREAEHEALRRVTLSGRVVDLGGDRRSAYRSCIGGSHDIVTVNLDERSQPDLLHDLEKPLPYPDASFDHALMVNVLEHVYAYRQLLAETARVVKPGGKVIIVVPFLFPLHPSPNDFWRFSKEALMRDCGAVGLAVERLYPLGTGVFAARYVMLDRLLPGPIRLFGHYTCRYLALMADAVFAALARLLGKRYDPADYALGYLVHAAKS